MEAELFYLWTFFIIIIACAVLLMRKNDKTFVLVHVVIIDDSTLKRIHTSLYKTEKGAIREMERMIKSYTHPDGKDGNSYYTAIIGGKDHKKLVINEVSHYFEVKEV